MTSRWIAWMLSAGLAVMAITVACPATLDADDDNAFAAELIDELATVEDESVAAEELAVEPEVIRERYSNRAVKIEREVVRDQHDNYVNHGSWRMWDQHGNMTAKGQYENGKRDGVWMAWYSKTDAGLFRKSPYKDFVGPFVSQANFVDGQLHGTWTMYDGKKRRVSDFNYTSGARHGTFTKYYVNGRKMEEVEYQNGEIHGVYRQWTPDGGLARDAIFDHGRTTGRKATNYRDRKKKTEGIYLLAKEELNGRDDWWTLSLATTVKQGQDEKHGEWRAWYPNGQLQVRGAYEHGRPAGETSWVWWYENGQQAVEGLHRNGQQHGTWVWWHTNGQKKLQGEYVTGEPSGKWIWWKSDGRVLQRMDFSAVAAQDPMGDLPTRDTVESAEEVTQPSILSVPRTSQLPELHSIKK